MSPNVTQFQNITIFYLHSRDRYEAMLRRQQNSLSPMMSSSSPSASASAAASTSAFRETPLSPAEIANNLRDELKRLRKRKLIAPLTAGENLLQNRR